MARFQASLKWGFCAAELEEKSLPKELADAKRMWAEKNPDTFKVISKFLRCTFVPENIFCDLGDIFEIDDDIEATEVHVVGADFKERSLPTVSATAVFNIKTKKKLSRTALAAWQEENEYLDNAVVFEWQGIDSDEDLSLVNHDGLSVELI